MMPLVKVLTGMLGTFLALLQRFDSVFCQLDTVHFYSAPVSNSLQCHRLCTAYVQCQGVDYSLTTRMCYLYSEQLKDMATQEPQDVPFEATFMQTGACSSSPCRSTEVCVLAASEFMCLAGTQCSDPPDLTNMDYSTPISPFAGTEVLYSCRQGYNRVGGTAWSVCKKSGDWSEPTLICSSSGCGEPPLINNMVTGSVASTTYNSAVVYSCEVGYTGTGAGNSVCQQSGLWSTPSLTCTIVDCGVPPTITDMVTGSVTSTTYNSAVVYSCDVGYTGTGDGNSVCQQSELWSTPSLICTMVECGTPATFPLTSHNGTPPWYYGSVITYQCLLGYNGVTWSGESTCLVNGTWSTAPTLDCQPIDNLIGTSTSGVNSSLSCVTKALTVVTSPVSCDPGQVLVDCAIANSVQHKGGVQIVDLGGTVACKIIASSVSEGSVRCCSGTGLKCEYLHSNQSEPTNDAQATLTCHKDFNLLGCSAYGTAYNSFIDGVKMYDQNKCLAQKGGYGPGGVTVNGVCCHAPSLRCVSQVTRIQDADLSSTCPSDTMMTGCCGHTWWVLQGYYISDVTTPTCHVPNDGDREVTISTICCTIG